MNESNHKPTKKENHDQNHDHKDHHESMIKDFKRRFVVSLVLTIPILLLSPMIQEWFRFELTFDGGLYVLLGLSTIVYFYGGWPFLKGFVDEIKEK